MLRLVVVLLEPKVATGAEPLGFGELFAEEVGWLFGAPPPNVGAAPVIGAPPIVAGAPRLAGGLRRAFVLFEEPGKVCGMLFVVGVPVGKLPVGAGINVRGAALLSVDVPPKMRRGSSA